MRSVCELAKPKAVFNFEHPNFEQKSNARSACIQFTVDIQSEVNILISDLIEELLSKQPVILSIS